MRMIKGPLKPTPGSQVPGIVCTPLQATRWARHPHGESIISMSKVYEALTSLSGVLYYLSTSINPLHYNIMSNKFRNAFKVTLSSCCSCPDSSQLDRTDSDELASRAEHTPAMPLPGSPHPRRLQRVSTDTSQLCEAPPQAQSLQRSDLPNVNEKIKSSKPWFWKQRSIEGSDSLTSPQSISNSSLREIDQELKVEVLETYLYEVNCEITGIT